MSDPCLCIIPGYYLTNFGRVSKEYVWFGFLYISDTCKYAYKESTEHKHVCNKAYRGNSSHPLINRDSQIKEVQKKAHVILS